MSFNIQEQFHGLFKSRQDIIDYFEIPSDMLDDIFIINADYDIDGYDGEANIIYVKDNKLYEVHASHCSCYGLEGRWEPEDTFAEAALKQDCFQNIEILRILQDEPLFMIELMRNCKSTPVLLTENFSLS